MHFSAPSHPLIQSFLLQKEEFQSVEKLIVENVEQGKKLLLTLETLRDKTSDMHDYRLITTYSDIVELMYDPHIIGIYPVETLDWKVDKKDISQYCLELKKGMTFTEESLIIWLSEHGYIARKSDEFWTYFRVGDTVSLPTKKGVIRVSFFGTKIEQLYLSDILITECHILSH
jgi:excinuclease UvrABC helicase subunit UvrB